MTEDVSGFWHELEAARVAAASVPIIAHKGEQVVTAEQIEQMKNPPDAEMESD